VQSHSGIRGTQSLQYQYSLTTGNTQSTDGAVFVDRNTSAYAPAPAQGSLPNLRPTALRPAVRPDPDREHDDRSTSGAALYSSLRLGSMRSTGAFTANRALSPSIVAYRQTDKGVDRIAASGLLGVRQLNDERFLSRLTERQRIEVQANRPDTTLGTSVPPPTSVATPPPGPDFRTSYQDLRDRFGSLSPPPNQPGEQPDDRAKRPTRAADPSDQARDPATPPTWEERMADLRERMAQQSDRRAEELAKKVAQGVQLTPEELKEASRLPADEETLRIIREGGGEVTSYFSGEPGSLFGEHLRAGQELMVTERYFDAEERFARALAMRPGDVTVMAARLHAQIGAGLYTSAALNLRDLLTTHPEVIGVKYSGATIPAKYRLTAIAEEMRDSLAKARRNDTAVPTESALLLAYIGFQMGDQAMVKEGLTDLRGILIPDPIVATLEGVWLVRKSPAQAPAQSPSVPK